MSELDKWTDKSEDETDDSGKIIIDLGEITQNLVIPSLDLTNYTNGINQSVQNLFDAINTSNFNYISKMNGNIFNIYKVFDSLPNTIISSQKRAIDEIMNALASGINYDSTFQNIGDTLSFFQERITPTMIESISNNLEKLSEIDFSDIAFSGEDIVLAIDAIEDDEFEKEMNKELAKEKDAFKVPLYIKRVIVVIYFIITFTADTIAIWNFTEEKVIPLTQEYFNRKQIGVFHTEEAGLTWLNDNLKSELSEQIRNNFRVVSKDGLVVRVGKSKDSRLSGTLNTGYIVQIIEKKRNWTYIMYTDTDKGVVIEGWTNTRHLKQIK